MPIKLPIDDQFLTDFVDLWGLNAFYCHHFGKKMFGATFMKSKLSKLTKGLSKHHLKNIHKTPFFIHRLRKSYDHNDQMFKQMELDFILTPTLAQSAPELDTWV